jgi:hypothetical protein
LRKGLEFISSGGSLRSDEATIDLGVGKNMVASINYWLRAMNVTNAIGVVTEFGERVFGNEGWDPYLEDISTLYLLHFNHLNSRKNKSMISL